MREDVVSALLVIEILAMLAQGSLFIALFYLTSQKIGQVENRLHDLSNRVDFLERAPGVEIAPVDILIPPGA
jgi:hypothetical protein